MNERAKVESVGTGQDLELNQSMPDIKMPLPRSNTPLKCNVYAEDNSYRLRRRQ